MNMHEQQLQASIQQEVDCANALLTALKNESDALTQHSTELLETSTQDKLEKMKRMEKASLARGHLLNIIPENEALQPPFTTKGQLMPLWAELMELAKECQELNQINGRLVERGFQQSRHALDILQGNNKATEPNSDLYNQSGRTTYGTRSRSIAQA